MDIIAKSADALKPISGRGTIVRQGWYDEKCKECHVTLWVIGENNADHSDDDNEAERGIVQVTIFSPQDEIALRDEIVALMKKAGATYLGTDTDETKPQDGIYMKPLRFEFYEEVQENARND